jgi:hypothetical protein
LTHFDIRSVCIAGWLAQNRRHMQLMTQTVAAANSLEIELVI